MFVVVVSSQKKGCGLVGLEEIKQTNLKSINKASQIISKENSRAPLPGGNVLSWKGGMNMGGPSDMH